MLEGRASSESIRAPFGSPCFAPDTCTDHICWGLVRLHARSSVAFMKWTPLQLRNQSAGIRALAAGGDRKGAGMRSKRRKRIRARKGGVHRTTQVGPSKGREGNGSRPREGENAKEEGEGHLQRRWGGGPKMGSRHRLSWDGECGYRSVLRAPDTAAGGRTVRCRQGGRSAAPLGVQVGTPRGARQ